MIEHSIFRGVFIHRKYNLNSSSYDTKVNKGSTMFEMKKTLRSDVIMRYEKTLRAYKEDKMEDVYCKDFESFIK